MVSRAVAQASHFAWSPLAVALTTTQESHGLLQNRRSVQQLLGWRLRSAERQDECGRMIKLGFDGLFG